jgi:hypothetical protein
LTLICCRPIGMLVPEPMPLTDFAAAYDKIK